MICRICNREYDDDFMFCPYCGVKNEWIICPKCNYSSDEYNFCPRCGTKLITYEEWEEKLIEIVKEKYQSTNIQDYVIKQIKIGLIMFLSEIDEWVYFKEFEPINRLDMNEYIENCIPDEFQFTEEMKEELIGELSDDEILSIDELNEKIMRKKEEKDKKEEEEKERKEREEREKWGWEFIKETEKTYTGTKMGEMRKYNKDLYG